MPTLEDGTIDYDHLPITRRKRNIEAEKNATEKAVAKAVEKAKAKERAKLQKQIKQVKAKEESKRQKAIEKAKVEEAAKLQKKLQNKLKKEKSKEEARLQKKAEKALAKAELRLKRDVEKKLDDALKNAGIAKKEKPKKDAPESSHKNYLPPKPFPYNATQMRRMIKNALRKYEQRIATLEKQMDDISATGTFMRGQIKAYEEVMLDLVQWVDE